MDQLNLYLEQLIAKSAQELHLRPNANPFVVSPAGNTDIGNVPLQGSQISMMVFPLIPSDIKQDLPNQQSVEFVYQSAIGEFDFTVQKSAAGFNVIITPRSGVTAAPEPSAIEVESLQPPATHSEPDLNSFPAVDLEPLDSLSSGAAREMFFPGFNTPPVDEFGDHAQTAPHAHSFSNSIPAFGELTVDDLLESAQEYVPPMHDEISHFPSEEVIKNPVVDRRSTEREAPNSEMKKRLEGIFRAAAEAGASDLHLSVRTPPMVRKDGRLRKLECGEEMFAETFLKDLLHSIMPDPSKVDFAERRGCDFAYEIPDLARFRASLFTDRNGMGAHFRLVPAAPVTAEQLGLPDAVAELCALPDGLIIVTGPAGSGRSTTLCAMINRINTIREDHIVTIEDPIEFVHQNIRSLVNQREVRSHAPSVKDAFRTALREDADVIMVGDMSDSDTSSIALEAAESGRLVFGTLHTATAASAVERMVNQFPADRHQHARVMLSGSLKAVVAQTLVPKKNGGRVAAFEVLIATPEIRDLIRQGTTAQITAAMQNGNAAGMVTLNNALFDLVQKDMVEPRDAYLKAADKTEFAAMLSQAGIVV